MQTVPHSPTSTASLGDCSVQSHTPHSTPACTQTPDASLHWQVSGCPCGQMSVKEAGRNWHWDSSAFSLSRFLSHAHTHFITIHYSREDVYVTYGINAAIACISHMPTGISQASTGVSLWWLPPVLSLFLLWFCVQPHLVYWESNQMFILLFKKLLPNRCVYRQLWTQHAHNSFWSPPGWSIPQTHR